MSLGARTRELGGRGGGGGGGGGGGLEVHVSPHRLNSKGAWEGLHIIVFNDYGNHLVHTSFFPITTIVGETRARSHNFSIVPLYKYNYSANVLINFFNN